MKTVKLTFKAPIMFTYTYEMDIDEIEEQDVNKYIADIAKDMSYFADCIYQANKEDLSYMIENNICLSSVQENN